MKVVRTPLDGACLIEPDRFTDRRGWFAELWNDERYRAAGIGVGFVQTNVSYSSHGVLRGMHFQHPKPQAKLVSVLHGSVFDVIVDVRTGSPTFGGWYGHELSVENRLQLFVPAGFAHGFLVTGADALVHYSCSALYDAAADRALAWDDPEVGIQWPSIPQSISDKDAGAPTLSELLAGGALPG